MAMGLPVFTNSGNFGAIGAIVAFCVGLAVGWLVHPTAADVHVDRSAEPGLMAPHEERPSTVHSEDRSPRPEEAPFTAPAPEPLADVPALSQEKLPARSPITNRTPTADPDSIFQARKGSDLAATPGPMQRLRDAVRISCQFDPGYGAQWNNGRVAVGTAAWQGGAIMYDQITLADGTAMMLETHGGTGSSTGEVKVRVAATRTGLHFSSFVPRGDLISTTVFASLDANQRFIAVMSTHTTGFNHNSSQFHGACDVLY